jgi:hypothetical protein
MRHAPLIASESRESITLDDGSRITAPVVTVVMPPDGPGGMVWRMDDGRLVVLTITDAVEGIEASVLASIISQLVGGGLPVLASNMRSLGVDEGLEAWARVNS